MAAHARPQIEAYIGASGSGKGVSVKRRLSELQPSRLIVWDARDEYAAHAPAVRTLPELVRAVGQAGDGPVRVRYVPGATVNLREAFGVVCRLAFAAGRLVYVAEELSTVTTPSWAPPAWRMCTTQGRHQRLHLIGVTQRPALIDKTFLANATRVRCGVLGYRADRVAMAAELDVSPAELAGLQASPQGSGARLVMLERDRQAGRLEWVELTVSRGGAVAEKRRRVTSAPLR